MTYFKILVPSWINMLVQRCILSTQQKFLTIHYMALSLCIHTHFCKCFHLHGRRGELKDGFYTVFFLKVQPRHFPYATTHTFIGRQFYGQERRRSLREGFYTLLFGRVSVWHFSNAFTHTWRITLSSWKNIYIYFEGDYLHRLLSQSQVDGTCLRFACIHMKKFLSSWTIMLVKRDFLYNVLL